MDNHIVSDISDKKLKILFVFLLCGSFSAAHNFWKFPSFKSTLNRAKRQINSFRGCTLLDHPKNGQRHVLYSKREYVPNNPVNENTVLIVECNDGYLAIDLNKNTPPIAYCLNGEWIGNVNQDCHKTCPPLNDSAIIPYCTINSQTIDCLNAIEGTTATTNCKPGYTTGAVRYEICREGLWSGNLKPCKPDCGISNVSNQTTIIDESLVHHGEYPWTVAFYKQNTFLCGGTIISLKFVVSVAHCFTDHSTYNALDTKDFEVIAGKLYKEIDDDRDKTTQQVRKIKKITVHEYYRGRPQNYQYDIAVLEMNEEFKLELNVQLACVDWDQKYEETNLRDGNKGVVVGWRHRLEDLELRKAVIPLQSSLKCKELLPKEFYDKYYTHDKICAADINTDISNCSRLVSGAGYYFQSEKKIYIVGIATLSPNTPLECSMNRYTLYTKVSTYNGWLKKQIGHT